MSWRDQLKNIKSGLDKIRGDKEKRSSPPPIPPHPPNIYWKPLFQQGKAIAEDWDAKIGNGDNGWGNQELQHYTANPENVFFTPDFKLVIHAISAPASPTPYTSARLVSRQTLSRDRGCLSAVLSLPCADGIWPAFWLLPQEPFSWPTDGEVDVAETWNADHENKSCLHWGHHHEGDRHRTMGTHIHDMHARPVRFDFAWDQPDGQAGTGRMMWWIDGRPVMKAAIPAGTRPMRDWTVLLNVAMGGNVCQGKVPAAGQYEMVVHTLYLADEPDGGWGRFEQDWRATPDGRPY